MTNTKELLQAVESLKKLSDNGFVQFDLNKLIITGKNKKFYSEICVNGIGQLDDWYSLIDIEKFLKNCNSNSVKLTEEGLKAIDNNRSINLNKKRLDGQVLFQKYKSLFITIKKEYIKKLFYVKDEKNPIRYNNNVNIEVFKNEINFTKTDGKCLVTINEKVKTDIDDISKQIDAKFLDNGKIVFNLCDILNIIDTKNDIEVYTTEDKEVLCLKQDNVYTYLYNCIDFFPNYHNILPNESDYIECDFTFDKKTLLNELSFISKYTSKNESKILIDIIDNQCKISHKKTVNTSLYCRPDNQVVLASNINYILDAVKLIDKKDITLYLKSDRVCYIKDSNIIYMWMPQIIKD